MASIEPFIRRRVVVLSQDARASQAARAMCENRIGCVVVSDERGRIAGIVTDRDLVCGLLSTRSDVDTRLVELMTTEPMRVGESAEIEEVARLMHENGIRRIPVVRETRAGRESCVGIVTLDDLIASRSVPYETVARIVQSQILRRRRGRGAPGTRDRRAEERSEARMEQTLHHFHNVVARKTGVGPELAAGISMYILGALLRRLHYTGAAHLISQLPMKMHEELLDLPAGPDRRITVQAIVSGLSSRFSLSGDTARAVLTGFCEALRGLVNPSELDHLCAQLPADLQAVLASGRRAA